MAGAYEVQIIIELLDSLGFKKGLEHDGDATNDDLIASSSCDLANIGVGKDQKNRVEEIVSCFPSYIREDASYKKQTEMALELYGITGEERHLLWAVCYIQLQVVFGEPSNSSRKVELLNEAKSLLEKHIASHSLCDRESLLVYISILEHQKDYKAAVEIVKGELGTRLIGTHNEVDWLCIQGRLLTCDSKNVDALEIFEKVLESGADDWETFLDYLGCLIEDDSRWTDGASIVNRIHPPKYDDYNLGRLSKNALNSKIDHVLSFIHELPLEMAAEDLKWPYLAKLEIERRKRLRNIKSDLKLMEAFVNYFRRFGDTPSFTSDVNRFMDKEVLTNYEDMVLVGNLKGTLVTPSILQVKYFDGLMTIYKFQDWSGNLFKISTQDAEKSVIEKVDLYLKNLALSKKLNLQRTALNDELLSLACSTLVQLYWKTQQLGYFVVAIMVLEFGLTVRPLCCQYKIMLTHLYSQFNSLPLAYEWYKTVNIKGIRCETFMHNIIPQMIESPFWDDTEDLLKGYLIFMDHVEESANLSYLALQHRNYSKVIEITWLKEQLLHSHQYLMARLEIPILQLKQESNDIGQVESVLSDLNSGRQLIELSTVDHVKSLTFNDNTESRPWWTPTRETNYLQEPYDENAIRDQRKCWRRRAHSKQLTETNLRKAIERRSILPRMINLCIRITSLSVNHEPYDDENSELKDLLQRYARTLGFRFSSEVVEEIDRILNDQTSDFEVLRVVNVIELINFNAFVNVLDFGSRKDFHPWENVNGLIGKCTRAKLKYMQSLIRSPGPDLNFLVRIVSEPMAWQFLIIKSCAQALPSFSKEAEAEAELNIELVRAIAGSAQSLADTIEDITNAFKQQIERSKNEKSAILLQYLKRGVHSNCAWRVIQMLGDSDYLHSWNPDDIIRNIVEAQEKTLLEFRNICSLKQKQLNDLKDDVKLTSYFDKEEWAPVEACVKALV